ncbi:MAG: hypothetical protein HY223_02530 [Thaumarchaeota archaeon]|nr:hypothetical protein [Nitrososphaerota archaeon]MBI3639168.1 hypothetical protein [Nitrososphaerota archaeon]
MEAHQRLLNSLAKSMEDVGITITHLDIDGTPEYFDEKYRKLPAPKERDGCKPDLEGMKGVLRYLGEAKIKIKDDKNLISQFRAFTSLEMNGKEIPLHVAVPKPLKKELEKKLYKLDLYKKYKNGMIKIWAE